MLRRAAGFGGDEGIMRMWIWGLGAVCAVAVAQEPPAAPAAPVAAPVEGAPPVAAPAEGGADAAAKPEPAGEGRRRADLDDATRDLLALIALPIAAHDARSAHVPRKEVRELLLLGQQKGVNGADLSRVLKAGSKLEKGGAEKFGAFVTEQIDAGKRGKDLVSAVHDKVGHGKGKRGDGEGPEGAPAGALPPAAPGGAPAPEGAVTPAPTAPAEAGRPEGGGKGEGRGEGKGRGQGGGR